MVYDPNIPQATDDLDESQLDILDNFTQLDNSFFIDHYTFSDLTANNGKHKTVTTPTQGSHPTTAAAEPKLYATLDSPNLGVIQYSRGPSNAVPCPITNLQSPATALTIAAGSGTIDIFNFTGLARAMATLYCSDFGSVRYTVATCAWDGTTLIILKQNNDTISAVVSASTILRVQNSGGGLARTNVFWTLVLHRIQ